MRKTPMPQPSVRLIALLLLALTTTANKKPNPRPPGADWPMFTRALAGTRYSPLTQINTANVTQLTRAWNYRFNEDGKPPITVESPNELYQEITPIVVN